MPFGIVQVSHDEGLPGTDRLLEDEHARVAPLGDSPHLKRVMYKGEETILIPQPSENDPNDPLLWPRWKKEAAFWVIFVNTIVCAILPGPVLAPATFAMAGIFKVSLTMIAELGGYQLLVVGAMGPVVSVLAQKYGKRPQFLFAAVMATVGTIICIVGSQQVNYTTLLAGRMVQGLGVTAWESLSVAAIGDMFYLHERGWRTAVMVAALACTASLVAIIGGVMYETQGWLNLFVACLPFNVVALITTVFLLPETQFKRAPPRIPAAAHALADEEKHNGEDHHHHLQAESSGEPAAPRKTYRQGLAPYGVTYSDKGVVHLLTEIFVHLLNPAVLWILMVSGVLISFFVVASYILAQVWSVPPYGLNVAQNGYFYAGGLVGGFCAAFVGPICDWSARALARLNGGVFEAEFRIPINVLGALCCGLGWFVFMWDVQHPRPDGYYLGAFCHGLVCFGISVPSTSAGLYILDSFPRQSTEVFVLQMMLKNFLFYAFSTFINTWAAQAGAGEVFKVFGITSLVLLSTCIPMYVLGKVNRSMMHRVHTRNKIFKTIG